MAIENNPFYVAPIDPFRALMAGQQSYDTSRKRALEQQEQDALRAAAPYLAGGDYKGALGAIGQGGSFAGLMGIANLASHEAQRKQAQLNADREYELNKRRLDEKPPHYVSEPNVLDPSAPPRIYGIDPNANTVREFKLPSASGNAPPRAGQPVQALPPGNPGRERDEAFLQTLSPSTQALVKGLVDYDKNPATLSKFKGHAEAVIGAAKQYDPTFDEKEYTKRSQVLNAFSKGRQGDTVRSFSVLVDHLNVLDEAAKALNNKDLKGFNAVANKIQEQFGYTAPPSFDAVKKIVGAELVKAVTGAAGALGDREEVAKTMSNANSYPQLKAVMDQYKKLVAGQLQGMKHQYETGTGRKNFDDLLSEGAKRELGGGSSRAGSFNTENVPAAPQKPADRSKGGIYQTPRGPLMWTGTGWVEP